MNYQYLIYAGHTSCTPFISHSLSSLSILTFSRWNKLETKIAYRNIFVIEVLYERTKGLKSVAYIAIGYYGA